MAVPSSCVSVKSSGRGSISPAVWWEPSGEWDEGGCAPVPAARGGARLRGTRYLRGHMTTIVTLWIAVPTLRVGSVAALITLVGAVGACGGDAHIPDEHLGTTEQNLYGSSVVNDVLDPAHANVVVRLGGYGGALTGCTGTLITPGLVLTAGHCIDGDDSPDLPPGATPSPCSRNERSEIKPLRHTSAPRATP